MSGPREHRAPRVPVCAASVLLLGALLAGSAPAAALQRPPDEADATRSEGAASPAAPGWTASDTGSLVSDIPGFAPVVPPADYRAAVDAGTRSDDGSPGPGYWQQSVDYRLRVRLDPGRNRLRGRGTVTYRNRSPDTLRRIHLNLYQNVFAEGSRRNRHVEVTGGLDLRRVTVSGRDAEEVERREFFRRASPRERRDGSGAAAADPVYYVYETMGGVALPRPLAPDDSVRLGFEWSFRVPGPDQFRMGQIDREVYNVAQWYPQVATYDDVDGHYVAPYLGDGEFYLEYGSFRVDVTVPEGWLVGATGRLINPGDVLPPRVRARLGAAARSDSVVRVVGPGERGVGTATVDAPGDTLTWRFRAERVRDFAFVASPRYVWDAVGADVGRDSPVPVHALYDPSLDHWREAARYSRHALEFFSDYIAPYPYPQATAAFGPIGGMEYPMLVFIGESGPGERLYSVLAHEFSHEWFPMMVGSREAEFAWMDEGLTTFNESLAHADFFGTARGRRSDMRSYLTAARQQVEAPLMRHTDHVRSSLGRGVAAYTKPATVLHALRTVLGEETFDRAYRRYAEVWSWKHPLPWDFFRMMEAEAGRDLDWFWREWFYRTDTLDQALAEVRETGSGVRVTVSNQGEAVMPVILEVTTEDGAVRTERWPASAWSGTRTLRREIDLPTPVVRIRLDPDDRFPDVDPTDDGWER